MTESQFIEQNKEKWAELEFLLIQPKKDADRLQELFVKVSSDLSYARTFYPKRSVRLYLNNLTQKVFDSMGKKKSGFKFNSIIEFFSHSLPQEAFRQRYLILISFLIFSVSMFIGALSSAHNPEFATIILGEEYIQKTDENINKGDPMAIYKDMDGFAMFEYITINNVKVAFFCFVLGLLGGIGTSFFLVYNGIMVGVFQYYFYSKGLFLTSFLTIWIHGTIEISSIIIAGAAGLVLGRGILFPGTYKRSTSLQIAAKRSIRLIFGTVPLFIIAGLLESFVTRLTEIPMGIKIFIIGFSLLLILVMFVIYPQYYNRFISAVVQDPEVHVQHDDEILYDRYMLRSASENISLAFAQFRLFFGINLKKIVLPSLAFSSIIFYFIIQRINTVEHPFGLYNFQNGGFIVPIVVALVSCFSVLYMELFLRNKLEHVRGFMVFSKKNFLYTFIICLLITLSFFQFGTWVLIGFLIIPIQLIIALLDIKFRDNPYDKTSFSENIKIVYADYFPFFVPALITFFFMFVLIRLFVSFVGYIVYSLVSWHNIFDGFYETSQFMFALFMMLIVLTILPLSYFLFSNFFYSAKCKKESIDLHSRIASFGQSQNGFE